MPTKGKGDQVETINLGTAGRRITIKDENGKDYFIDTAPGKHLLVVACIEFGRASFNYDHQNVLARMPRVFEYKHYRKGGSKFWTSAPGMEIVFAIPKTAVEVIQEPGYSYVKAKIAGEDFTFSVSGGTGTGGWTDYIGPAVTLCGTRKVGKKQLNALASVALDPTAATLLGLRLPERWQRDDEVRRLPSILAKCIIPAKIKPGVKIHLLSPHNGESVYKVNYRDHGVRYNNKVRLRQSIILDYGGMNLRAKFAHIDWKLTAEVNGWALPDLKAEYRIPFEQKPAAKSA
jgi:hypothetical protein